MKSCFRSARRLTLFGTIALLSGCSSGDRPPLGRVSGVVSIDGQPASGLAVMFSQSGFRSSSGFTNDAGQYELKYLKGVMGAVVGDHQVRIEYLSREGAGRKLRLPERYNRKSELTASVDRGRNQINFDLQTE